MNIPLVESFLFESNKIEGIKGVRGVEFTAFKQFLDLNFVTVSALESLVKVFQPNAYLRNHLGVNVQVGNHIPPCGGPMIEVELESILESIKVRQFTPYKTHLQYENLHPFTDGNGRSGRALWAWQMLKEGRPPGIDLGFLHAFYYQALSESRISGN